jgi:hypothetical protein
MTKILKALKGRNQGNDGYSELLFGICQNDTEGLIILKIYFI